MRFVPRSRRAAEVRKQPLSVLSAATIASQLLASGIRKGGLRQLAVGHPDRTHRIQRSTTACRRFPP